MWYLTPVSLYDMAAMEQWLERMAQRGRFLVDAGPLLSWFEKGEPRAVRCRAEPLDTESPIPTQERLDYYESCGWHYLCTVKSFYRIFQSGDPAAEELHTDPVVLAAGMRDLEERLGMTLVFLVIFLPLLVFCELYFNRKPAEFPTAVLYSLCCCIVYGWHIAEILWLRSLRRQLLAGSRRAFTPIHYRRAVALRASAVLLLLSLWLWYAAVTLLPWF